MIRYTSPDKSQFVDFHVQEIHVVVIGSSGEEHFFTREMHPVEAYQYQEELEFKGWVGVAY